MSGLEVAGIILGVLPIAISVLSRVQNEEGPLFTLLKYKGRLDELIQELEQQQTFWQVKVVFLLRMAGIPDLPDDIDKSMEACAAALRHAPNKEYIEGYLEGLNKPFLDIMRRYGEHFAAITLRLSKILSSDPAAKHDLETINSAHADLGTEFSMIRAVKFAIGSKSCKKLVEGMCKQRNNLNELLDLVKDRNTAEAVQPTRSSSKMVKLSTQVQMSAASLYSAASRGWKCDRHSQHAIMIRLENRFDQQIPPGIVMFRLYFHDKGDPLQFQQVEVAARARKSRTDVLEPQQTETHRAASRVSSTLPGITVTTTHGDHSESPGTLIANMCLSAERARDRGENLALDLVDGSLKVATESSMVETSFNETTTLAELLEPIPNNEGPRILAEAQCLLAFNVATAALQLRLTSWSGTMWDKHELKFLVGPDNVVNAETPYIEKTIENSQAEVFPEMDRTILEIAILVLEILHCTSIEVWARENDKESPEGFEKRQAVATSWLYHSKENLVLEQRKAVSACLAELALLECAWEPGFQQRYCENVVRPLRKAYLDVSQARATVVR